MLGKWSAGWAVSGIFLLIFGPVIVSWACAAPLAGPGLAKYSPPPQAAGVAARRFGNAVLIDEQEGRYGQAETGLDVHYNRVDGLFVQLGLDTKWKVPTKLRLFAWGGYAFAGKVWRYEIGLNRWLDLGPNRLEAEVRNYDLTYTEDEWLMPTYENSAAAFFFREDFRDYYRRSGTSFHLINTLSRRLRMELAYLLDEHETLNKETDWSLFGGDKKFRGNPAADGGAVHSMVARVGYDTRDDFLEPSSGFWVDAGYEKSGNKFGGDYGFQRFVVDFRRYLSLSRFENIDVRLRTGTASGNLPNQKAFDVGGIGSLRGYKFKEFRNFDRIILGNVEYRIQFGRFAPSSLEDKQIVPFYDFGLAWSSNDKSSLWTGFDQLKWDRLQTSVGIGFSTGSDDGLRVNLARRLDDRDRSMTVTVRIHRIF
jgi:outer membrane protein assembly factor BamA